jgi:hypothetical protein
MPHNQPWLDKDPVRRKKAELLAQYELQAKKIAVLNAVIKARLNAECDSNNCKGCGNFECVKAHQEYLKLWPEAEKESFPASSASTTDTTSKETRFKSGARFRNSQEQKLSDRPGIRASGLNLFNLDQEGKAA